MCSHASRDTSCFLAIGPPSGGVATLGQGSAGRASCGHDANQENVSMMDVLWDLLGGVLAIEKLTDCLHSVWRSSLILSFAACYLMWRMSISVPFFFSIIVVSTTFMKAHSSVLLPSSLPSARLRYSTDSSLLRGCGTVSSGQAPAG